MLGVASDQLAFWIVDLDSVVVARVRRALSAIGHTRQQDAAGGKAGKDSELCVLVFIEEPGEGCFRPEHSIRRAVLGR